MTLVILAHHFLVRLPQRLMQRDLTPTTAPASSLWRSYQRRGSAGRRGREVTLHQALREAHQKVMRQDPQRHVVIPPPPKASLVQVHPDLPFALLKAAVNEPAHPTDADQRGEQRVGRRRA